MKKTTGNKTKTSPYFLKKKLHISKNLTEEGHIMVQVSPKKQVADDFVSPQTANHFIIHWDCKCSFLNYQINFLL